MKLFECDNCNKLVRGNTPEYENRKHTRYTDSKGDMWEGDLCSKCVVLYCEETEAAVKKFGLVKKKERK